MGSCSSKKAATDEVVGPADVKPVSIANDTIDQIIPPPSSTVDPKIAAARQRAAAAKLALDSGSHAPAPAAAATTIAAKVDLLCHPPPSCQATVKARAVADVEALSEAQLLLLERLCARLEMIAASRAGVIDAQAGGFLASMLGDAWSTSVRKITSLLQGDGALLDEGALFETLVERLEALAAKDAASE